MPRGAMTLEQRNRVKQLYLVDGLWAGEIYRQLQKEGLITSGYPTKRTIERLVRELAPAVPSSPWSFADADPEESRVMLDILPFIVERTNGQVWPTRELVSWLARIRMAAPTIPPEGAYVFARLYQHQKAVEIDSQILDLWLACRTWESDNAARQFLRLLEIGREPDEVMELKLTLGVLIDVFLAAEPKEDGRGKATR